jgi:plastocyanin
MIGAFIIGGFALAAGLAAFQTTSHSTNNGGFANFEIGPFEGTLSTVGSLFLHEEITLPPNTETTLIFENQDATPHNVAFFRSDDFSASNLLRGCITGCDGGEVGDGLRTELLSGPIQREFTFITPKEEGQYVFVCEIHPDTMRGILTIAADAPLPGTATPEEENPTEASEE